MLDLRSIPRLDVLERMLDEAWWQHSDAYKAKYRGESELTLYVLVDPRNGAYRYAGQTINPGARASAHKAGLSGTLEKLAWIAELKALGLEPAFKPMEVFRCRYEQRWQEETRFILELLQQGHSLLNGECKRLGSC